MFFYLASQRGLVFVCRFLLRRFDFFQNLAVFDRRPLGVTAEYFLPGFQNLLNADPFLMKRIPGAKLFAVISQQRHHVYADLALFAFFLFGRQQHFHLFGRRHPSQRLRNLLRRNDAFAQVQFHNVNAGKIDSGKVNPAQINVFQIDFRQIKQHQIHLAEIELMRIIFRQILHQFLQILQSKFIDFNIQQNGVLNINVCQFDLVKFGAGQIRADELRAGKHRSGKVCAAQIGTA